MDGVIELTSKIYSELTGKFLFKYLRGNRYIMVMYNYDRNSNLTEAMKNCEVKSILNAYETLYNSPVTKGLNHI